MFPWILSAQEVQIRFPGGCKHAARELVRIRVRRTGVASNGIASVDSILSMIDAQKTVRIHRTAGTGFVGCEKLERPSLWISKSKREEAFSKGTEIVSLQSLLALPGEPPLACTSLAFASFL